MVHRKRGPEHDWSGWLRKRLHLYRSERVGNYLDRRERLCLDRPAGVCGTNVSFHSEISDPRSRTFFKFTQLWAACRERAEIIFYIAVLAIRWQFARGLRIRDFDVGSVGSVLGLKLGADFIYDVSLMFQCADSSAAWSIHLPCRELVDNQITSLSSGTFNGLAELAQL